MTVGPSHPEPGAGLRPVATDGVAGVSGVAPEPLPAAPAGDGLGTRAARGTFVTLAGQLARMLLQVGSVVVLARLLLPRDYGLIAIVLVLVGIGEIVRDFGLTNATVQAAEVTVRQRTGLFWTNTAIGVVLCLAMLAGAPLVAAAFHQPVLEPMARVLSLTFVLNGLAAQYRAHLTRDLRFGSLAIADVTGQLAGLGVAVALAVLGTNQWALVGQQLSVLGVSLVLVVAFGRWWPGRPSRHADIGGFLRFGAHLAGTSLIYYLSNNLDTITIASRFSATSLGVYNRAFSLLMTPLNQLRAPATTVALPILSRIGSDYQRAADYLRRGQLVFGYTIVPVLSVVVGASGPVVAILLGPHWAASRPILAYLSVGAACQLLAYVAYWVYLSRGLGRELMRYTVLALVLQAAAIVVGSFWGVVGVAAGYGAASLLEWPMSLAWLSRITPIPTRELYHGALRILACALAAGAAAAASSRAVAGAGSWAALAVALVGAGLVYLLAVAMSAAVRDDVHGVSRFVREMLRR